MIVYTANTGRYKMHPAHTDSFPMLKENGKKNLFSSVIMEILSDEYWPISTFFAKYCEGSARMFQKKHFTLYLLHTKCASDI